MKAKQASQAIRLEQIPNIGKAVAQDLRNIGIAHPNQLYTSGENLATFPQRGRIVPKFNQENIRELLIENYRLVGGGTFFIFWAQSLKPGAINVSHREKRSSSKQTRWVKIPHRQGWIGLG